MRRFSVLSGVLCMVLALGAVGCDDNNNRDEATEFAASSLSGASAVPPTNSAASGSATFTLNGTTVQFTLQLSGISGVTSAHLHSGAPAGTGPMRVLLYADAASGPINGTLVSDSFTSSDVVGISFTELVNQMRDGAVYVEVHTVAFPDGEVRGQIQPIVGEGD